MLLTEDSVNSEIHSYLKATGVNVDAQVILKMFGKSYKPDFFIQNGLRICGEGEWQKSIAKGLSQAAFYLESEDVDISFTIIYSNELENDVKNIPEDEKLFDILGKHSYHVYYRKKKMPSAHKLLPFNELPDFLKTILHEEEILEPNVDVFIETINQLADEIFKILPAVSNNTLELYKNILGSSEDLKTADIDFDITARNAAGYLFINQLIFYSILSHKREDFPAINVNSLNSFADLKNYFLQALTIDFKPVFSIDVISQIPIDHLDTVKDIIRSIQFLGPEYIQSDLIGRIFHKLIPSTIRKKVAAYYTKPESAELLAFLSIRASDVKIIDPACGSGQLLIAAYKRMRQLYELETSKPFDGKMHKEMLEDQITGIDIMPFSAHLSMINLVIQDLDYLTNFLRIAIFDSTKLEKNLTITPLQSFLRQVQTTLTDFLSTNGVRKRPAKKRDDNLIGSITLDGEAGVNFEIKEITNVIMNPPFTRQELINKLAKQSEKQYKTSLIENITRSPFKIYQKYLNEKQSFSSYFLFIADKILESDGTIAAVLPATLLHDDVNSDTRRYFFNNYSIKYVINRYDALNFSDDTTFKEILLIMQKTEPSDNLVTFISLQKLRAGVGADISYQEKLIDDDRVHAYPDFTIQKISQSELNPENLSAPIALRNPELQVIWQDASRVKRFKSGDAPVKAQEGARSRKYGLVPEMCIVEEADSRAIFKFRNITSEAEEEVVKFASIADVEYSIKRSSVIPYVRNGAHNKMNLADLNEYVIMYVEEQGFFDEISPDIYSIFKAIKTYNEDASIKNSVSLDELNHATDPIAYLNNKAKPWVETLINIFGDDKEAIKQAKKVLKKPSFEPYQATWSAYLKNKCCYLGAIETLHIEAPNTYFFAFYTGKDQRVFSSVFNNIISLSEEEAKINCLWLNSAVNFIQLFIEQIPTGWFKIRQYVVQSLRYIDAGKLKDKEKLDLIDLFEEISKTEFPCIWRQILHNIAPEDVENVDKDKICEMFHISEEEFLDIAGHPFDETRDRALP